MTSPLSFDPIAEARRQWDVNWGAGPGPSMSAVTSIMRSQQILMARLNEALREWELTFPRYEALMLLFYSREGALPLGKISDRLQVHRASVTNVVDRLADQGLVTRQPHDRDRRTVMATITPRGRDVARAATAVLNGARFGMDGLSDAECESVAGSLESLRRAAGDFSG
ncbi:MAG TPA: MarR family transcriptional regulator [Solirubrobacteraceae bacterium]|nr:MarR family transcriptional regulator [Solirubrobacteraceae bacterium]